MNAQNKWKPVLLARRAVGLLIVFFGAVVLTGNLVGKTGAVARSAISSDMPERMVVANHRS